MIVLGLIQLVCGAILMFYGIDTDSILLALGGGLMAGFGLSTMANS